jgi:hypothetical protein
MTCGMSMDSSVFLHQQNKHTYPDLNKYNKCSSITCIDPCGCFAFVQILKICQNYLSAIYHIMVVHFYSYTNFCTNYQVFYLQQILICTNLHKLHLHNIFFHLCKNYITFELFLISRTSFYFTFFYNKMSMILL